METKTTSKMTCRVCGKKTTSNICSERREAENAAAETTPKTIVDQVEEIVAVTNLTPAAALEQVKQNDKETTIRCP